MDLGNIVYILAVIAYFIYSATQSNKKKRQAREAAGETETESEPERGVTFEDLLKEIREAQKPKTAPQQKPIPQAIPEVQSRPVVAPKPAPEPVRTKRYESYDDEITHYEGAYLEDAYERVKKEEERIAKVAASIPSLKPLAYTTKDKPVNRYAALLKNPQSVKDAIVLGEILNRRHF